MFKKIFLTAAVIFTLAAPVFVSAAGLGDALGNLNAVANTEQTGLSSDLPTVVATVIKTVLALVGTIFLVLTIYAGILWMTAQGEEEKVNKAKEIIKASIIGLVIIMSAYAITFFVTSRLTGLTSVSDQNNLPAPEPDPEVPVDPSADGCCTNNAVGGDHTPIPSPYSMCSGSQEDWAPSPPASC